MKLDRLHSSKVIATLAVAAGVLAACGGTSNSATSSVSSTTSPATKASVKTATVRYGVLPAMNDAPYIVAQHLGYYSKLGINVVLTKFNGGPLLMQALAAGSIDGGQSGTPPVVEALSGHVPVKIVNGAGTSMMPASLNMDSLLVTKSSGITSLKQLKGQTIAVQSIGGTGSLLLERYVLPSVGLTTADVHIEQMPWANMGAAFSAGKIVAGTPFTPFLQHILATESNKVSVLANLPAFFPGKSFPLGVNVFSSKALTRLGTTTMKSFLAGTAEGVAFVEKHPNQAKDIFAAYVGLSPSAINNIPFGQFITNVNVHSVQLVADAAFALKRVPTDVKVANSIVTIGS